MKKLGKKTYLISFFFTLIVYIAGIITGIFTERFITKKFILLTKSEIERSKEKIKEIRRRMENLQLENFLLVTFGKNETCKFLSLLLEQIEEELSTFWKKLPKRLEEYELKGSIPKEYEEVKRDYMLLSIRAWSISVSLKDRCNKNLVPVLYFYSKKCEECIKQGEALDKFKLLAKSKGFIPMVFTVDAELEEPVIKVIKSVYNITEVPSILIENKVLRGFHNETELLNSI